MPRSASRSPAVQPDAELRLPRPPGVIRRFWARHPIVADALIAGVCLLLSLGPFTAAIYSTGGGSAGVADGVAVLRPIAAGVVQWFLVLACASLLVRRRLPWLPFSLGVVGELAFLVAGTSAGMPVLLVAVYSLAVYRSNRAAWIGLGAACGAVALATIGSMAIGAGPSLGLNSLVATALTALIGALVGINVGNRKRYLEAIIDRSRQLLVERDQQAQLAAAAERTRIAREMHDIVSHSLTVVVALAEGASATHDTARAREAMDAAASTARSALTEMRAMLGVLRDPDSTAPLSPAAPPDPIVTVSAAQRAGFPATIVVSGGAEAPETARFAISRIVQESVTNAMRHAPDASVIRVRIDRAPNGADVEVVNDGVRGTARTGGYGLRGLAERIAQLGGTLEAGPDDGDRWRVRARIPYPAPAAADALARSDAHTPASNGGSGFASDPGRERT